MMSEPRMVPSGFVHMPGYFDPRSQAELLREVEEITRRAPFYTPTMPKSGKPLSVKMTNAGSLGWVTDKEGGYRYQPVHPVTSQPWPAIPDLLLRLWEDVAHYPALPEACLINFYGAGAKLGSHVDTDEEDTRALQHLLKRKIAGKVDLALEEVEKVEVLLKVVKSVVRSVQRRVDVVM